MGQKEEEEYMENRRRMEHAITAYYESCGVIGIDAEGFAEDVVEAVSEATGGKVKFEDWFE